MDLLKIIRSQVLEKIEEATVHKNTRTRIVIITLQNIPLTCHLYVFFHKNGNRNAFSSAVPKILIIKS